MIKCLSLFLIPTRSSSTPLYPQNVAIQGTYLDFLLFYCFHFKLTLESIKELESASVYFLFSIYMFFIFFVCDLIFFHSTSNGNKFEVFFARYKLKCGALIFKSFFWCRFSFQFWIFHSCIYHYCLFLTLDIFVFGILKGGIWKWHYMQWNGKDELGRINASCKWFHFYYFDLLSFEKN